MFRVLSDSVDRFFAHKTNYIKSDDPKETPECGIVLDIIAQADLGSYSRFPLQRLASQSQDRCNSQSMMGEVKEGHLIDGVVHKLDLHNASKMSPVCCKSFVLT